MDAPDVPAGTAILRATVLAASVDDDNLLDPDPRSLVADITDPLAVVEQEVPFPGPGGVGGATLTIEFGDADLWTPAVPWLYVLRLQLLAGAPPLDAREGRDRDEFWTTFGIRHVSVDPNAPQVLLNGEPAFFRGVGLHGETLEFGDEGELVRRKPGADGGGRAGDAARGRGGRRRPAADRTSTGRPHHAHARRPAGIRRLGGDPALPRHPARLRAHHGPRNPAADGA